MLIPELKPLYERYLSKLKPLVAEYESRNEDFVTPLLKELPFMFDSVAMYSSSKTNEKEKEEHIKKAEEYLGSAINDIKCCLIASMMKNVKRFKSRYPKSILQTFNNGEFIGSFLRLENEVKANKKNSYPKLKEMEQMIEGCHQSELVQSLSHEGKVITMVRWIITILITLAINYIFSKIYLR